MSETNRGIMPLAALAGCQRALCEAGMADAQSVARHLVCHVLSVDMHGLMTQAQALTGEQSAHLDDLTRRVCAGEPVQYTVGYGHLMGLRFVVTPDVLIPRFDTETLVQWALSRAKNGAAVLDACTGSGCVAIALKVLRPDLRVYACDISLAALSVARMNADIHGTHIEFACGELTEPFANRAFDLITANPPYIAADVLGTLPENVRLHEPRLALCGGADGLDVYRRLVPQCAVILKPGGALGVEIGYDQADAVAALFEQNGLINIRVHEDMEHRPRVVAGEREERR
jgi:release factor glutamine methyltransferase